MVLKTFNVEESIYEKYSEFCKENGISMSNQINTFIKAQVETEPKIREEYLKKLDAIRKGKFIKIGAHEDFKKRYQ
ncbi:hypothetical protein HYW75_00425 [Candidatus Pacearchaeota archaeon]|nr:hypothetical protein [Candidatus Pacearchaeota archaeon]